MNEQIQITIDDFKDDKNIDKFQFKEFNEQSPRIRHPSFNFDNHQEMENIAINIESDANERELRNIQAKIEQINQSFTPYTRDLLASASTEVTQMYKKTTTSTVLIEKEQTYKETTTTVKESSNNDNNFTILLSPNIESKNFVSTETIAIGDAPDENIDTIQRLDRTFSTNSDQQSPSISDSSTSSLSYNRAASWTSIDSSKYYQRSQSSASAMSTRDIITEEDLEYIKGRDDWPDTQRINISEEIESDEYHHHRRYSETAETLEYILGRDDWIAHQAEKRAMLPEIIELNDELSRAIIEQIDSDEYHHTRRMSECLDFVHQMRDNDSLKFLTHGSVRNGRERSPYKLLTSNIGKEEFLDRYYWKGGERLEDMSTERLASEVRDLAEVEMIENEREMWLQNANAAENNDDHNENIEDCDQNIENNLMAQTENTAEETTNNNSLTPDVDVIDVVVWNINEPNQEDEQSVHDEFDNENFNQLRVQEQAIGRAHSLNSLDTLDESIKPDFGGSCSSTEKTDDEDTGASSSKKLKKSKTTRNLLDTERLSIDLTGETSGDLSKIAEKTKSFIDEEKKTLIITPTENTNKLDDSQKKLNYKIVPLSKRKKKMAIKRTASNSTIDDLLKDTSLGPWFHK